MRGNKLARLLDFYFGVPLIKLVSLFKKKRRPVYSPRKILVILLGAIGDTLLLVPAVKILKKNYPSAEIHILCTKVNNDVALYLPGVSRVISCSFKKFLSPAGLVRFIKLIHFLKRQNYDIVLDFEKWVRISALITCLVKAKFTVGFQTHGQYRHYCYDLKVHKKDKHVRDLFVELAGALPAGFSGEVPGLDIDPGTIPVRRLGSFPRPFLIIHPGAGGNLKHGGKRIWPVENYTRLIKDILLVRPELTVLLTGSREEVSLVDRIIGGLACPGDRVKNVAGKTSIHSLFRLVAESVVVVCGNTGIMHIAVALDTPVVALHGPTDYRKWGPLGPRHVVILSKAPCAPCLDLGFEYKCRAGGCMRQIEYREVKEAVLKVIMKN